MRNTPEVYTPEHKQARKELGNYIPADLAVKFPNADFSQLNKESLELLKELNLRLKEPSHQIQLLWLKILAYNKQKYAKQELSEKENKLIANLENISNQEKIDLYNSIMVIQWYKQGLVHKDDDVKHSTARSLAGLAANEKIDTKQLIELYKQGLANKNQRVVWGVAQSFAELAANEKIDIKQILELYKQGLADEKDHSIREAMVRELLVGLVANKNIDINFVLDLYKQGLASKDDSVRLGTAAGLKGIAADERIDPNYILESYKQNLNSKDREIIWGGAQSISGLAANKKIDFDQLVELHSQGLESDHYILSRSIAESLAVLAANKKMDFDNFLKLYHKGLKNKDKYTMEKTAKSIGGLALNKNIDINQILSLYKQGLSHEDDYVKQGTAESLGGIAASKEIDNAKILELYEQGITNENSSIMHKTARSLGGIAATGRIDTEELLNLYKQGFENEDSFVRLEIAESLKELAANKKIDINQLLKLYKIGFADVNHFVIRETAESLGELFKRLDLNYYNQLNSLFEAQKYSGAKSQFLMYSIGLYFKTGEKNLFSIIKKSTQYFDNLEKFSEKMNSGQELEQNKVKDVNFWLEENAMKIADLSLIDEEISKDLMFNLLSQSLLKTEAALNLYMKAIEDNRLSKNIKQLIGKDAKKQIHGIELGVLLETASGYKSLDAEVDFENIVDKYFTRYESSKQNYAELQKILNKELLKIVAKRIGIAETNVEVQDLAAWDLEKLPHLVSNAQMIAQGVRTDDWEDEEKYGKGQLELYQEILRSCFEGNYEEFLTDTNQENIIGRDVAIHNEKVKKDFEKIGIAWSSWLGFSQEISFDLVHETKGEPLLEVYKLVRQRLKDFQNKMEKFKELSGLNNALVKDLSEINKAKKQISQQIKNVEKVEELEEKYLANYKKTLEYLIIKSKKEGKELILPPELQEIYAHLRESLQLLIDTQKAPKETNLAKETFKVRKWLRDPRKDFFQGNYTHCCIAVGVKETPAEGGLTTLHPETIQQYLVDLGIQVIEVLGPDNKPAAQTWVFVSKDRHGKPVMVMDNFEVNNRYGIGKPGNELIKENVFQYMKLYAQQCGINKIVLGEVGTNDINTDNMKSADVKAIKKLGGYLWGEEYFLEAKNQTNPYSVAENILGGKSEEQKEKSIKNGYISVFNIETGQDKEHEYTRKLLGEIMRGGSEIASQDDLQTLEVIEREKFSNAGLAEAVSPIEDILDSLQNTEGVQMIFRDDHGNLVGYLSSKPAVEARDDFELVGLKDEGFNPDERTLYLESIAGRIGRENYIKILSLLKEQAKKTGYDKLCLHGINVKLNAVLKLMGFETKRIIENWVGGYNAEYMEMLL